MTSSRAPRFESECQKGAPPRRHQIIGFLRALTLASDCSGYGAAYESDIRMTDGVKKGFAAEPVLLLDQEAFTVRWSDSMGTLSRKYSASHETMPAQLPHEKGYFHAFIHAS